MSSHSVNPQPGDWFVVDTGGGMARWIERAETIEDGRKARFNHAGVATRWAYKITQGNGSVFWADWTSGPGKTLMIAEAQPGGAVEVPWHYAHHLHKWSCSKFPNRPGVGRAARAYTQAGPWGPDGVPYSYLDYLAIKAYHMHIRPQIVIDYMADPDHMICSQLADQACLDDGWHLFDDGRPSGDVMPSSLSYLLTG